MFVPSMTPEKIARYHNKWVQLEVITREGRQLLAGRLEKRGSLVYMFKLWHTGKGYFFKQRCQYPTEQAWFVSITELNYCETIPGGISRQYYEIKKIYNL